MDTYEDDDVSLSPTSPKEEKKPDVKAEDDDDVYDDALDLDTREQHQRVMLVRLPEYFMAKLRSNSADLSGAELGKVLIPEGPENEGNRMRLLLNSQVEVLRPLPHRYDLVVTNPNVENIYVMKEQDLRVPKLEPSAPSGGAPGSSTAPVPGSGSSAAGGAGEPPAGGVRKLKRTALVGHAIKECSLRADLSDPNYSYVLQQRKLMELPDAERQTTLLDSMAGVGGAKYGATLRQQKEAWRRPVQRRAAARQAGDGKATRIPRNDLLDMLFRAFEETPYWTIRSLRERTKQPEVYLRSVLDSIAVLNKRGPYAMKYGLKEEYKALQISGASVESLVQKAPVAPDDGDDQAGAGNGNGEADGDSDDMEMENIEIR